jgi:putative long chain acyl-CoA synthase
LALGGGFTRTLPGVVVGNTNEPGRVTDLEAIDPDTVQLPTWYRPNPGQARDLALVIVTAGRHQAPHARRITNRRWAFSALGTAAACTLTPRDTVYCCLPLHHPAGLLVSVGGALIGGARLALAEQSGPRGNQASTFWAEVRRTGATVVFYAGEMCRSLAYAPHVAGEENHPVRLFAGSGMRRDVWRRMVERFGGHTSGILEFYASTEANAVLVNASGEKAATLGRPLPGSAELAIVAYDFNTDGFHRNHAGRLHPAGDHQPGLLPASLDAPRAPGTAAAEIAHIVPRRIVRDVFASGDNWFLTGDIVRIDADGDYWFVDRSADVVRAPDGPVWTPPIEDALYALPEIALAIVFATPRADGRGEEPSAAVVVRSGAQLDRTALSNHLAATLPPEARPRLIHELPNIPMTDGFRPLKSVVRAMLGSHPPTDT